MKLVNAADRFQSVLLQIILLQELIYILLEMILMKYFLQIPL